MTKPPPVQPSNQTAYSLLRYSAAFGFLLYGFAKLWGAQFTILDSELDKPMGHVSGFWLTWYYFGYSQVFGLAIGLVQIAGALLLTFRRTTLLAACVLAPVITNIVLIDFCYRIDMGATVVALCLLGAISSILWMHRAELFDIFWLRQNRLYPNHWGLGAAAGWTVRVSVVVLMCVGMYYVANYNNRRPTPIDGAWQVTSAAPAAQASSLPMLIFFEHNRAYWCTFKLRDDTYETHHFEVDANRGSLDIWQNWLVKGAHIFEGRYELNGDNLVLNGTFLVPVQRTVTIHLMRKQERL